MTSDVPQPNASAAQQLSTETDMPNHTVVKLTPAAIAQFRSAQKEDGKTYLRVSVKLSGPTGYMYDLTFDDQLSSENDYIDKLDGLTVVVDKRSAILLDGSTIDWQTTPDGRQGFQFDNPNAIQTETK